MARRANLIKAVRPRGKGISIRGALILYKAFVRPVIEYACAAITPRAEGTLQDIASTERHLLRYIADVSPSFPSNEIHSLVGMEPILHRMTRLRAAAINRLGISLPDAFSKIMAPLSLPLTRKPKLKNPTPARVAASTHPSFYINALPHPPIRTFSTPFVAPTNTRSPSLATAKESM
ncbi:hypothetical protein J437_LFUL008029 [Ladona fulva]|uniref:Uncharacterized protein n=1 Tax=Ladona fulva TaxID=123851 RepID=A0A8K0P7N9_LADFU|nr:hypothetical protein J437_LFUL008029 [Ladona fulva]